MKLLTRSRIYINAIVACVKKQQEQPHRSHLLPARIILDGSVVRKTSILTLIKMALERISVRVVVAQRLIL